jgi:hypothetical protein
MLCENCHMWTYFVFLCGYSLELSYEHWQVQDTCGEQDMNGRESSHAKDLRSGDKISHDIILHTWKPLRLLKNIPYLG